MADDYEKAAVFMHHAMKEVALLEDPSSAKVLDFGAGSGKLVHCLLSLGYDAYGCDIQPYWQDAANGHAERLSVIPSMPYRLPYDDETFDAVISTSVLEHAQNKEDLFFEIRRVLKTGGHSMHLFPGKWYLPFEPHIYVPLVNCCWPSCPGWWLALWARLGVRNEFQHGKSWQEVAELNSEYCKRGLSYWSNGAYQCLSMRVFGNFSAPMRFFIEHGYGGVSRLLRRLPFQRLTGWIAGEVRMNFIVQRKL